MTDKELTDKELKEQFDRNGYVLLPGFFADEELAEVDTLIKSYMERAEQVLEEQRRQRGEVYDQFETRVAAFGGEAAQEQAFRVLEKHARMDALTKLLIGEGYEKEGLLVMVTPRGNGQGWHRDCFDPHPGHFVMNRLIYTRDIRPEQGALIVVPGSHRLETFPPGGLQDPIEGEVVIAPEKGALIFVHTFLFHRVYPNETDLPRVSINYRVRPHNAPQGLTSVAVFRTGRWDFRMEEKVES